MPYRAATSTDRNGLYGRHNDYGSIGNSIVVLNHERIRREQNMPQCNCEICQLERSRSQPIASTRYCYFCGLYDGRVDFRNGVLCENCYSQQPVTINPASTYLLTQSDIAYFSGRSGWNNFLCKDVETVRLAAIHLSPAYLIYTENITLSDLNLRRISLILTGNNVHIERCAMTDCKVFISKQLTVSNSDCSSTEFLKLGNDGLPILRFIDCSGKLFITNSTSTKCAVSIKNSMFTKMQLDCVAMVYLTSSIVETLEFSGIALDTFVVKQSTVTQLRFVINTDVVKIRCEDSTVNCYGRRTRILSGTIVRSRFYYLRTDIDHKIVITDSDVQKIPTPKCAICTEEVEEISITILKDKIVHESCWNRDSHYDSNSAIMGNRVKLPPFSFELEMYGDSSYDAYQEVLLEGLQKKFRRCSDGTVSDEMKSPIYQSERSFLEILPFLRRAQNFVDYHCGTHIHVECSQEISRWYLNNIAVFDRVTSYMSQYSDNTIRIWGRDFCNWCNAVFDGDRYYWINFQSSQPTIEFRLPRLIHPVQFRRLVLFCRVFVRFLIKLYETYRCEQQYRTPSGRLNALGRRELSLSIDNFYRRFEKYVSERKVN